MNCNNNSNFISNNQILKNTDFIHRNHSQIPSLTPTANTKQTHKVVTYRTIQGCLSSNPTIKANKVMLITLSTIMEPKLALNISKSKLTE